MSQQNMVRMDGPGEGAEPGMLLSCICTDLCLCSSHHPCRLCSVHAAKVAVGMQQVPLHVAALQPRAARCSSESHPQR